MKGYIYDLEIRIGSSEEASSTVSFAIASEVIFKVKRSYFKVKFPNFANFGPFLSLKGLEKKTQMLLKMTPSIASSSRSHIVHEIVFLAPLEVI